MFAIGDSLREARTRRGLSPADVQKGIRIRERYLTALEEEKWELLPGEAYTKGFLRTYAEFLGLDGNLYVDEYNTRIAHDEERQLVPQSLTAVNRRRRGMLRTLMALFVLGAAVAAFSALGLGNSSSPDALGNTAAPATKRLAKAAPVVVAAPAPLAKATMISAPGGPCWLSIRTGGAERPNRLRRRARAGEDAALRAAPRLVDADGTAREPRDLTRRAPPERPAGGAWQRAAHPQRREVRVVGGFGGVVVVPCGRAGRRAAASSVAPIEHRYRGSLRPCITTPIAPARRTPPRQNLPRYADATSASSTAGTSPHRSSSL